MRTTADPLIAPFVVSAPGRVNVIGEHTDYNEGFVLPLAIQREVAIHVVPRTDRIAVLSSEHEPERASVDLNEPLVRGARGWQAYVLGVLAGFQRLGWEIPGFEARITASLPAGAGLSSSAALEVGLATVVETLCGRALALEDKALLCQQAEHEFAGVPCGIMDQFAVTFAREDHAMLLDCRSRVIRHVPLRSAEVSLLIIHSGVKHSLADGEYAKRRAQCEAAARLLGVTSLRDAQLEALTGLPDIERKRARHVLTENDRTLAFVAALESGDWQRAGAAMHASHESLRADFEVSCSELDLLVALSREIAGVYGCRMTGGGFGGCAVALIEKASVPRIMTEFRQRYQQATGIDPLVFVTNAAGGPRILRSIGFPACASDSTRSGTALHGDATDKLRATPSS